MKYLILSIIITFLISSCKEKPQNEKIAAELKSFYGKHIVFTDNLKSVFDETSYFKDLNWSRNYKIISYIDSTDCTPCSLEPLSLWKNFTSELTELDTELIVILKSDKINDIHEILTRYGIHFPVFADKESTFKQINHLPSNHLLHTFLLDKHNQVVLAGSPIQNEKSWQLYKKVIHQLKSNKGELPSK